MVTILNNYAKPLKFFQIGFEVVDGMTVKFLKKSCHYEEQCLTNITVDSTARRGNPLQGLQGITTSLNTEQKGLCHSELVSESF